MSDTDKYISLIIKNLTRETDESESAVLKEWTARSEDNRRLSDTYTLLWNRLENRMPEAVREIDVDEEWEKFKSHKSLSHKKSKSVHARRNLRLFAWSAAAGIILVLGLLMLLRNPQVNVVADAGVKEIILPDKSSVTLNTKSEISYSKSFKKDRTLTLSGEAYFKAEPDSKNPFRVMAGEHIVEVVGTEFFVSTVNGFEVIVNEGVVKISTPDGSGTETILKAGERLSAGNDKGMVKSKNTNQNFPAGKMVFENAELSEIAAVLERNYQVKIDIPDAQTAGLRMTATFENQDIESVLKVIEATLNITISKQADKIIIH